MAEEIIGNKYCKNDIDQKLTYINKFIRIS